LTFASLANAQIDTFIDWWYDSGFKSRTIIDGYCDRWDTNGIWTWNKLPVGDAVSGGTPPSFS